ncbi:hypothetical protein CCR75_001339 [Bremia lactucae]|uniref:Myosin motor domain-containing protein n=1 Tax=Bremia lactucae TaxID=4779 RepID=A0A976FFR5_BRELC|nr:hypothetical protein CCR75_001339 [Bremia lactucae]
MVAETLTSQYRSLCNRHHTPESDFKLVILRSTDLVPQVMTSFGKSASIRHSSTTSQAVVQLRVGDLYWKQHGPYGWTLGQVTAFDLKQQCATFVLLNESTGERLDPLDEKAPLPTEHQLDLRQVPLYAANPLFRTATDMTSLRHLHEAALAKNLEDRSALQNQRPYTFMANVLIAVNPLRHLPDPEKSLFVGQPLDRCPPHPFNVAENAYRQLCAVRAVMQNQSIIISGESGSGKTETSKMILDFLTMRAVYNPAVSTASCASASEDEMDPEITARVRPVLGCMGPPGSSTMAMSYPHSRNKQKLSPVAVGERLMETIPILESFGNAKTHRNHNSSRFGKYMRLQFATESHELSGASIDTYLLEKSRLVFQPQGERNFHIFYELLHSDDTECLKNQFHLIPKTPNAYSYLNQSGCVHSDLLDDAANFRHLKNALQFIGIHEKAQYEIFRLMAGLLHMGNIHISQEDTAEGETACIRHDDMQSQLAVQHASELLGVSVDQLTECILLKRIMTRGSRRNSIYYIKRDVRNAVYSRDTIAKTIYETTFTWLMWKCAAALDYDAFRSDVVPYIGVLDIFGFEDFEPKNRNSFEQLLINYANETLQSVFNACIFEAEQTLYKQEQIDFPTNHSLSFPLSIRNQTNSIKQLDLLDHMSPSGDLVVYADNRECLNLIASRHGGLFATIDNVSRLPMPSDRKLNERLHTLFKRHPCFPTPHPKDLRDTFQICHYAGTVTYTIDSFVDKNNNIISDQFEELLKHSSSRVLHDSSCHSSNRARSDSIVSPKSAGLSPLPGGSASSKRLKGGSTSNLFSMQMKGLTSELEGTNCNFIRCMKPNTQMKVGLFDRPYVVEQLRCSGTVQACEVLRVGLPTRILYAEVVDVYRNLLPDDIFCRFNANDKLFTQAILYVYDFSTSAYRMGTSRLFFRTGKIALLDKLLTPAPVTIKNLGQELVRFLRKKHWIHAVTAIMTFNAWKRIFDNVRYQRRATILQCMVRQHSARKRVCQLRKKLSMHTLWTRLAYRAQTMRAYQDCPDDKMVLLEKVVAKKTCLPESQRWLVTWLGPLQQILYMQKQWKRLLTQFTAKRGFVWLLETVRKKRSTICLQSNVRAMLARMRYRLLKKKALARSRWHKAFLQITIFSLFCRCLRRIHVNRLEKDNAKLTSGLASAMNRLTEIQDEAKVARLQLKELHVSFDHVQQNAKCHFQRVEELEQALERKNREVAELQRQMTTGRGFVERIVCFFTCSAAVSPPVSPREMVTSSSRLPPFKRQIQSASEETSDKAERIVWATPLSDAILIPQDDDSSTVKRCFSGTTMSKEATLENDVCLKDADMLWSMSRYLF